MNEKFPFDKPRALALTDKVTEILKTNVNAKWDKMSGELFSSFIDVAMEDIARCDPWLLR